MLRALSLITLIAAIGGCAVDRSGLGSETPPADDPGLSLMDAGAPPSSDASPRQDAADPGHDASDHRPDGAGDAAHRDGGTSMRDGSPRHDASDAAGDADDDECGTYPVPDYDGTPCTSDIGDCVRDCTDGECARACIDESLAGEPHDRCVRCYERTQMKCVNELECQDVYDRVLCCIDEWCEDDDRDCRSEVLETVCAGPWDDYRTCYFENEPACLWRTVTCIED